MRPSFRSPANKYRGARKFRRQSSRTKAANMRVPSMRGGIRF